MTHPVLVILCPISTTLEQGLASPMSHPRDISYINDSSNLLCTISGSNFAATVLKIIHFPFLTTGDTCMAGDQCVFGSKYNPIVAQSVSKGDCLVPNGD